MPTLEPDFLYGENAKFMGKGNAVRQALNKGFVFRMKKYGEKFFCDAYFMGTVFPVDFSFFIRAVMIHFNFCCVGTIGFLQGHFFGLNFLGGEFFYDAYFQGVAF